jgi:hypothetical protein
MMRRTGSAILAFVWAVAGAARVLARTHGVPGLVWR